MTTVQPMFSHPNNIPTCGEDERGNHTCWNPKLKALHVRTIIRSFSCPDTTFSKNVHSHTLAGKSFNSHMLLPVKKVVYNSCFSKSRVSVFESKYPCIFSSPEAPRRNPYIHYFTIYCSAMWYATEPWRGICIFASCQFYLCHLKLIPRKDRHSL